MKDFCLYTLVPNGSLILSIDFICTSQNLIHVNKFKAPSGTRVNQIPVQ